MTHLNFSSLRVQLLLLVILTSIPALLLNINNTVEESNAAVVRIQEDTLRLTQLTVSTQEQWIEGARQLLVSLKHFPVVRNSDSAACSQLFADMHKYYPQYANIFAVTSDGDVFCSAVPMKQPVNSADLAYFQRVVSSRNFSMGDYQASGRITGKRVIAIAYPIFDNDTKGNLQAVVGASMNLNWLNELAEKIQLPPNASFTAIDRKGTILARYPNPENWIGQSLPDVGIINITLNQHKGTAESIDVDGVTRFSTFAPVLNRGMETGIFVIVGIPPSIAFAEAKHILIRNLAGLSIAIFLILMIAWFGIDAFLLRKLNTLMIAIERVGSGELGVHSGVPYDKSEVGKLARVFDGMVELLQEKEKQRKHAEEKLHEVLLYTRSLIEVNFDSLVIISPEGKITDVNKATELVTGVSREQLIGNDFSDYFTDAEKANEGYQQVLEKGFVKDYPLAIRHVSGSITDVLYNATLYMNAAGNAAGVFAAARDITERKKTEDNMKRYATEIERSNKELQEFAYIASHDLQEPLRMISSYLQLIERRYKGNLDKNADEFINFAMDGAERMQNMINGLLAYSRVETKSIPLKQTDCNLVIKDTLSNLKVAIDQNNAVITCDSLPTLMADSPQLVQIFQNLISNAIKFHGREPPRIHISAERKEKEWQFCVLDNGIGIDPKYKDRLFKIFKRLHGSEYPGTGIGLAVCKRIVERHGGKIWVESKTGCGSSFYFTIPMIGGEN